MNPGDFTDVAVTRRNQCPARHPEIQGRVCNRPVDPPHSEHADVSPSGLVLLTWGDPDDPDGVSEPILTEKQKDDLGRMVGDVDEVCSAIDRAEWTLRELKKKYAKDELMTRALDNVKIPFEPDGLFESEDPDDWGAEILEM